MISANLGQQVVDFGPTLAKGGPSAVDVGNFGRCCWNMPQIWLSWGPTSTGASSTPANSGPDSTKSERFRQIRGRLRAPRPASPGICVAVVSERSFRLRCLRRVDAPRRLHGLRRSHELRRIHRHRRLDGGAAANGPATYLEETGVLAAKRDRAAVLHAILEGYRERGGVRCPQPGAQLHPVFGERRAE